MKKIYVWVLLVLTACSLNNQKIFEAITIDALLSLEISKDFVDVSEQDFLSLNKILDQQDIFSEERLIKGFLRSEDETKLIISEIVTSHFTDEFSKYKQTLLQQFESEEIYIGERIINDLEVIQLVIKADWQINRFFVKIGNRHFKIDYISNNSSKISEEISYSIDSLKKYREE